MKAFIKFIIVIGIIALLIPTSFALMIAGLMLVGDNPNYHPSETTKMLYILGLPLAPWLLLIICIGLFTRKRNRKTDTDGIIDKHNDNVG